MQYSICELHKIGLIKSCTCGNDLREMLPHFRVFFIPIWIKLGRNDIADFAVCYVQQLSINKSHSLIMLWLKGKRTQHFVAR